MKQMNDLYLSRTPAAQRFRNIAGHANFRLNTIIVGLEGVKKGTATKPPDLAVRWEPKNLTLSSQLARGFATNAIMVYVVDALDTYMRSLGNEEIWIANDRLRSLLRGEFQIDLSESRPCTPENVDALTQHLLQSRSSTDEVNKLLRDFSFKHFGRRKIPSMRSRFEALSSFAPSIPSYYTAAIHLLISWRNRHVHGQNDENISNDVTNKLLNNAGIFYEKHSNLDVQRLLEDYRNGSAPTLKEVSSLISISHRVVAIADTCILKALDVDNYLITALSSAFRQDSDGGNGKLKNYWGKDVLTRTAKLSKLLVPFGAREVDAATSNENPRIPREKLLNLAELEREQFAERVKISTV